MSSHEREESGKKWVHCKYERLNLQPLMFHPGSTNVTKPSCERATRQPYPESNQGECIMLIIRPRMNTRETKFLFGSLESIADSTSLAKPMSLPANKSCPLEKRLTDAEGVKYSKWSEGGFDEIGA